MSAPPTFNTCFCYATWFAFSPSKSMFYSETHCLATISCHISATYCLLQSHVQLISGVRANKISHSCSVVCCNKESTGKEMSLLFCCWSSSLQTGRWPICLIAVKKSVVTWLYCLVGLSNLRADCLPGVML